MKGKHKYVPPNVLQELENIKQADGLYSDADCFRRMTEYSIIGRAVKKRKLI